MRAQERAALVARLREMIASVAASYQEHLSPDRFVVLSDAIAALDADAQEIARLRARVDALEGAINPEDVATVDAALSVGLAP